LLFPINSAILFYSYIRVWQKSERKFTLLCWNENVRKGSFRLAKREIYEQKTEEILLPIVAEYDFELVDVEYVKEGSTWYLRAYIDKPGGITVNDCEMVSRRLSNILDEKDYIEDSYVMEISSPGLGRPLKKEKDFKRSLGREVEIRTYCMIDKSKEFIGILKDYDDKTVTIEPDDGTLKTFERGDIALIRLAFDF
jgi:ribosome maturation factor RimP